MNDILRFALLLCSTDICGFHWHIFKNNFLFTLAYHACTITIDVLGHVLIYGLLLTKFYYVIG